MGPSGNPSVENEWAPRWEQKGPPEQEKVCQAILLGSREGVRNRYSKGRVEVPKGRENGNPSMGRFVSSNIMGPEFGSGGGEYTGGGKCFEEWTEMRPTRQEGLVKRFYFTG